MRRGRSRHAVGDADQSSQLPVADAHVFDSARRRARARARLGSTMRPLTQRHVRGTTRQFRALRIRSRTGAARCSSWPTTCSGFCSCATTRSGSRALGRSRPATSTCRGRVAIGAIVSGFACPAFAVAENEHEVTLTTETAVAAGDAATLRPALVRQRPACSLPIVRRYAYQWSERNEHRSPLHGARADRPVLRPRRQDRCDRPARPAPAHACARRAGLRRADVGPAVQALAVPARPR